MKSLWWKSAAAAVIAYVTCVWAQGATPGDSLASWWPNERWWSQPSPKMALGARIAGPEAERVTSFTQSVPQVRQVSPRKAFLLSLILPGLGERACGASTRGWAFTVTEATLWSGVAAFRAYGHWRTEDYRAYAVANAGVRLEGKSHRYFVDIGNYPSLEAYNAAMLRDRNLARVYQDAETYFWRWPSEVERVRYAHLRVSADKAYQRSVTLVGAIIANHLVSAIDAMWVARRVRRHPQQGIVDVDLDFAYSPAGARVGVTVMRHL